MRSIIDHLGTQAFTRLRIGIGRPASGSVAAYVLANFRPAELEALETTIFPAALALLTAADAEPR